MNVGFVGKGRVAKSFSKFLEDKGVRVAGFHTRSVPNAKMLEQCDLLFIATPDDQIGIAAESLSTSAAFICHFSGALSSDVLLPLKRDGVTIVSLHPAMTFTEQTDLTGVPFAFEGSGSRLEEFTAFLRSLGIDFFQIDTASKPLYHAAMCNISNHITCLVYMTEVMLKELHINEKNFEKILRPLSTAALQNALTLGPMEALTGPVSRGDIHTLQLQMPFVDDTYRALASRTADLAAAAGRITQQTADNIKEVLNYGNDHQ